ncbi:MAG: hypothetical protein ACKO0Z_06310 [Betaproteobacteria bacterium]
MLTFKVLSVAALICSIAWFIHSPDYEPAVASITALSACIASFLVERKRKQAASMHQEVAGGAVGIQARGNVTTGNINTRTTEK